MESRPVDHSDIDLRYVALLCRRGWLALEALVDFAEQHLGQPVTYTQVRIGMTSMWQPQLFSTEMDQLSKAPMDELAVRLQGLSFQLLGSNRLEPS